MIIEIRNFKERRTVLILIIFLGVYRESYQKELFSDYTYGNYYMQDINVVGKILYTCSEFLYKHRNVPKDKLN